MFIVVLNISVLIYILCTYGLGLGLLLAAHWGLNLIGIGLLIHSLVLSAAAIHELIHGHFFPTRWANEWAGRLMTHLNGACYVPYKALVQHHFKHHRYHADFVPFDLTRTLQTWPRPLYRLGVFLEWAYFPLLEFMLRWRLMLASFTDSDKARLRGWTVVLLCGRGGLFALLGWMSPKALVGYGVAYICFVNLMRFVDAFHHTYEYVVDGERIPKRDHTYEEAHTFSNVVSTRYPWLNLLYLNFGYHNAHHHDVRCPWYQLPQLHRRLYGAQDKALLPLPQLIRNYHRFRIDRLFGGQGIVETALDDSLAAFTGGIGVSFLTPP